jgi:hypothetical protein
MADRRVPGMRAINARAALLFKPVRPVTLDINHVHA